MSSQSLKYILSWVCSNDLRPICSSSFDWNIFCINLFCLFYSRMERSRGNEHRMESTDGKSYAVQLRKLCSHILGKFLLFEKILYTYFSKKIIYFWCFLGPAASEEILSTQFRAALQVLSSSTSGQENFRDNEFVITEKIKKLLVRFT